MKMLAPRLRHRVELQEFVAQQDDYTGAVVETWQTVADNVPAEIWPMSGREFVAAQSIQAGVNTKITIRFVDGIKPAMRVLHDTGIYNIKAVLPDPTLRRHLTLMAEVGVNEG
jgi:SPP1 family predicted phage head-tail adaptor